MIVYQVVGKDREQRRFVKHDVDTKLLSARDEELLGKILTVYHLGKIIVQTPAIRVWTDGLYEDGCAHFEQLDQCLHGYDLGFSGAARTITAGHFPEHATLIFTDP
jgi:hypothetical protein